MQEQTESQQKALEGLRHVPLICILAFTGLQIPVLNTCRLLAVLFIPIETDALGFDCELKTKTSILSTKVLLKNVIQ